MVREVPKEPRVVRESCRSRACHLAEPGVATSATTLTPLRPLGEREGPVAERREGEVGRHAGGPNRIDVGHFGPETCLTVENGSRYKVRPCGSKHSIVLTLSKTIRAGFAGGPKGPSLTAVARAALPVAGRDGGIGQNTIEQRDSLLRSEADEERTEKSVRHVSGPKCQICTRSLIMQVAALPTSPSPALSRQGPSLSP